MEVNENTEHDVFFRIEPHIKWCEIKICEGGWENRPRTRNGTDYIGFYYDEDFKKEDYDKIINRLEELLNDLW